MKYVRWIIALIVVAYVGWIAFPVAAAYVTGGGYEPSVPMRKADMDTHIGGASIITQDNYGVESETMPVDSIQGNGGGRHRDRKSAGHLAVGEGSCFT